MYSWKAERVAREEGLERRRERERAGDRDGAKVDGLKPVGQREERCWGLLWLEKEHEPATSSRGWRGFPAQPAGQIAFTVITMNVKQGDHDGAVFELNLWISELLERTQHTHTNHQPIPFPFISFTFFLLLVIFFIWAKLTNDYTTYQKKKSNLARNQPLVLHFDSLNKNNYKLLPELLHLAPWSITVKVTSSVKN